jgi:hypothetical protein
VSVINCKFNVLYVPLIDKPCTTVVIASLLDVSKCFIQMTIQSNKFEIFHCHIFLAHSVYNGRTPFCIMKGKCIPMMIKFSALIIVSLVFFSMFNCEMKLPSTCSKYLMLLRPSIFLLWSSA